MYDESTRQSRLCHPWQSWRKVFPDEGKRLLDSENSCRRSTPGGSTIVRWMTRRAWVVFGFDHGQPDVFAKTVDWIETNHLECATFHILTPYPGTPLFARMEAEGRLLYKDWNRYDTGHVVFQPRGMTVQQLAEGYAWCYRRLFSHRSIWRRRPADPSAVLPYLGMAYLYKRSNWLWRLLIRHRLTAAVWRPLLNWSRLRHLRFRRRLAGLESKRPATTELTAASLAADLAAPAAMRSPTSMTTR